MKHILTLSLKIYPFHPSLVLPSAQGQPPEPLIQITSWLHSLRHTVTFSAAALDVGRKNSFTYSPADPTTLVVK